MSEFKPGNADRETTDGPEAARQRVAAESLRTFAERVFVLRGVPPSDARQAADVLLASDLRGIDSHGVSRLPHYAEQLRIGRVNPQPQWQVVRQTEASACVDGDNGLGLVIGPRANELAMEKAERVGVGAVTVHNSNHFGIAGYYPLRALERDMIGLAMTNASSLVAPLWSSQRMLGTNPLAIAFPGCEEPPIVIDMATAAVAFGKVVLARHSGQSLPEGWAVDGEGRSLHDPHAFDRQAALLPLGSDRLRGGHKGYCLGAMVDHLCGVLSGACWGPFAPMFYDLESTGESQAGRGLGHFFNVWRIDGFSDPDAYKRRVDQWVRTFRAAHPAPGTSGPLVPGDPEREAEQQRSRHGVPLPKPVYEQLLALSKETGIAIEA